ncbi:FKBP-like peptidyl-prolyl cis-trans isomerase family protein [Perilla frutescens var. hirtella]|uniref:peptidylprolyl isomerase n=1 Tax=Perilla frutescens var. hirtella TaxID=608512 RepID=A0AAD4J098_PERFH|nr:FKBP-like peptidyl-prolyl cis-trans isomerase family protein [Perilla frutescens var. hirtella]KAH6824268.1 FKBP-like peptidyl-prolyl cis-trans isomerase family protein [Perilla frutescens var. hirtella]
MASLFSSPPFLSHPITRGNYFSSAQPPPSPPPSNPPPKPPAQQLSLNSVEPPPPPPSAASNMAEQRPNKAASRTSAESTDWIASTLTRRFGIGAGLAWVAFLAVGVVSEQIKTRLEVSREEASTRDVEKEEEVVLPNGIRYYEIRVGGGASPRAGDLVVINVKGSVEGSREVFVDTYKKKRPVALVLSSRPYGKGICEGLEFVLRNMKAGGKRRVFIPPNLGFGEEGADLGQEEFGFCGI